VTHTRSQRSETDRGRPKAQRAIDRRSGGPDLGSSQTGRRSEPGEVTQNQKHSN
jgi:hypothetical protein